MENLSKFTTKSKIKVSVDSIWFSIPKENKFIGECEVSNNPKSSAHDDTSELDNLIKYFIENNKKYIGALPVYRVFGVNISESDFEDNTACAWIKFNSFGQWPEIWFKIDRI